MFVGYEKRNKGAEKRVVRKEKMGGGVGVIGEGKTARFECKRLMACFFQVASRCCCPHCAVSYRRNSTRTTHNTTPSAVALLLPLGVVSQGGKEGGRCKWRFLVTRPPRRRVFAHCSPLASAHFTPNGPFHALGPPQGPLSPLLRAVIGYYPPTTCQNQHPVLLTLRAQDIDLSFSRRNFLHFYQAQISTPFVSPRLRRMERILQSNSFTPAQSLISACEIHGAWCCVFKRLRTI